MLPTTLLATCKIIRLPVRREAKPLVRKTFSHKLIKGDVRDTYCDF